MTHLRRNLAHRARLSAALLLGLLLAAGLLEVQAAAQASSQTEPVSTAQANGQAPGAPSTGSPGELEAPLVAGEVPETAGGIPTEAIAPMPSPPNTGLEAEDEAVPRPSRAAHLPDGIPFGIGDENPAMLTDPRFLWLGVRFARLIVPWDTAQHPEALAHAGDWLDTARQQGVQPLIAFDKGLSHPNQLPGLAAYEQAVGEFMRHFPWVDHYQPWNEENQGDEPTHSDPARAAAYFNWLSVACAGCSVTAADLLDGPSMGAWLRRFLGHAHDPRLWGLHPYYEMAYGSDHDLSLLSHLVHGRIWLTEAGMPMWHFVRAEHRFRFNTGADQAHAARRLLAMVAQHRRISRLYFYQWRSETNVSASESQLEHHRRVTVTWDSGLLNPACGLRPAFGILARSLGRRPSRAPRTQVADDGQECVLSG